MSRISVLGLGAMGSRMAATLLKAGHEVTVWNRSVEKTLPLVKMGAIAAETARAAVRKAEFVISMVRDDEASQQIWLGDETGALMGLPAGAIAIESSTLSLEWIRELAAHFQSQAMNFLEAPVAGSRPQAEAAQLIYFVGGEKQSFELAKPLFQTLGSAVHHTGSVGSGMAIKLAVNTLFGVQAAAMGELIGFIQRCGLAPAQAMDILTSTPVCSPAAKGLAGAMVAGRFEPMFPISLVIKDLGYLCDAAQVQQASVPMGLAACEVFERAIAQGHGEDNITGVVKLYAPS